MSESEFLRRSNIGDRRAAKMRAAGQLVPDQVLSGGRIRLYRVDRLPTVAALIGHPESQLPN